MIKPTGGGAYGSFKPVSAKTTTDMTLHLHIYKEVCCGCYAGPGQYYAQVAESGPAFSMGARPTARDDLEDLPGPGDYEPASPGREGPAFTMGGRPEDRAEPSSPGPGERLCFALVRMYLAEHAYGTMGYMQVYSFLWCS